MAGVGGEGVSRGGWVMLTGGFRHRHISPLETGRGEREERVSGAQGSTVALAAIFFLILSCQHLIFCAEIVIFRLKLCDKDSVFP